MGRIRVNISVNDELWSKFADRCDELGHKRSNMVEVLIAKEMHYARTGEHIKLDGKD